MLFKSSVLDVNSVMNYVFNMFAHKTPKNLLKFHSNGQLSEYDKKAIKTSV